MSNDVPVIPKDLDLTPEQIEAISGGADGSCTPQQLADITAQLRTAYDNLVDFTSYVIERVVAPAK